MITLYPLSDPINAIESQNSAKNALRIDGLTAFVTL